MGRRSSLVDANGDKALIRYEAPGDGKDFDATWCPPDFEVVMPPGSQPPGKHLSIKGEVPQEILDLL